ncbi:site-specific integrase [Microlunatus sp. Gsoil 973]|uniref:tyrosine-type recombinase/integrase n=1 Tax=Microlunatus sp. Gsoil 973 TaxID=2672569 RepID=UPI001E2BCD4C|nr:site-specific integrase [Microlunatus sp. Gsoil 973]
MKPLGLGEHGDVTVSVDRGYVVATVQYRNWSGRYVRVKRNGRSKAAARRRALDAVHDQLEYGAEESLTKGTKFAVAVSAWLEMFELLVERGRRSPSTLALYRNISDRIVLPGLGSLRLGEIGTPRLDRFLQGVLRDKGVATAKACRSVLSGVCGWLVRQGAMRTNPVRDLTPIEVENRKRARALDDAEIRAWLAALDSSEFARRHDLPELVRFMLATGTRIGEAVGVTWTDLDLDLGIVQIQRTIIPVKGAGLVAHRVKSDASERGLFLPDWCVEMLKARRVRLGGFDGPVFASTTGGWRDRGNVGKAIRQVRVGTDFEWLTSHTFRKTVATLLDDEGASARRIADQLGHARVSMTQDVYLGRKPTNAANVAVLSAHNPDAPTRPAEDAGDGA